MNRAKQLIVFSGLPGTGKSKLADFTSTELGMPIIAKDWVEAALWRNNIRTENNSGSAAYDVMTTLAKGQLERNISLILDSVATSRSIRRTWRELAEKYEAKFVVIECICSSKELHKERLMGRKRNIVGWPELTWDDVLEVQERYEPWNEKRFILDSVDDFKKNTENLMAYLDTDFLKI